MQRILVDTQATLTTTFEVDGTPTDPSPATATVVVTRDDGTEVYNGAATRTGTGAFSYTLSAADNDQFDILTVAWTSSLGTLTSMTEVVGGFLFTVADARRLKPLQDTVKYPADRIIEARTLAETALEDLCGVAFVPRYTRETFSGNGSTTLLLRPRATAIRSVTSDGTVYTTTEITGLVPQQTGAIYNPNRWTLGYGNLSVGYVHGYASPPPRVSQACLLLAKNWLVDGPLDDRMTSMSTEDGTFSLLTPGLRGSFTGIPEVDACVQTYGLAVAVA